MVYDFKTKNMSFFNTSVVLRNKGVKNNKFMLTLIHPELSGVDPHSDNLTSAQKIMIYDECCKNKWYFLREVVRLPIEGTESGSPYELNLGNATMSYLKSKNVNQLVLLPRQVGKTICEICDDVWALNFAAQNTNLVYVNKEFKDSKEGLRRYKNIRSLLPKWLLELISSKDDKDNEEIKIQATRNNSLKAMPAATTLDGAEKLGRGLTTALVYFDEFAFLKFNNIIYAAMVPAWNTAALNAKKNGSPFGITITTTPNVVDQAICPQGYYCKKKTYDEAARFQLEMFDMTDDELYEYIETNSSNTFVLVEYGYKEVGKTDKWFHSLSKTLGDLGKIKRELLLEWPKATENSVFSEAQLETLNQYVVKEPVSKLFIDNKWLINFYDKIDLNKNYILSCDVSGGLSNDNSVICFIDPESFKPIGYFKNNKIDTDSFKKLIQTLMVLYFRHAYLVIESNSYGLNILDTLMKDPAIEPRMYKEDKETLGEKKMSDGLIIKRKTKNIAYGVATTKSSRDLMYDILITIVDDYPDTIIAPELYEDISKLERKKNLKIEAAAGEHDDCLMAYLIFRYAVYYGKCFKERWGISPIASSSNVKVISDEKIVKNMERLLMHANSNTDALSGGYYDRLLEENYKMLRDSNSVEDSTRSKQLRSFVNIFKYNND